LIINQFVIFSKSGLDFFNFSEQTLMDSSLLSAYITSVMKNIENGTVAMDDFCGILYLDSERRMTAGFTVYESREVYGACSYYAQNFSVPDEKYCNHVLSAERNYIINPKKAFAIELDENVKAQIELELTSDRFKRSMHEKEKSYTVIPIVWQKNKINVEKGVCKTFSKILQLPKSQILKELINPIITQAKGFEGSSNNVKIRTLCYSRDIITHLKTHFISREYVSEEEKILCYGILRGRRDKGFSTELDLWVYDSARSCWEACYCLLLDFTFDKYLLSENFYDIFGAINDLKTGIVRFSFTHRGQKLIAILVKCKNLNLYPQNIPTYDYIKDNETKGLIIILPEENCKIFSNLVFERELSLKEIEEEDLSKFLPPEDILKRYICKTGLLYISSSNKVLDREKLFKILANAGESKNNYNIL